jgi:hypothetical protein
MTVVAGSANTLQFLVASTTGTACGASPVTPLQCSTPVYTCPLPTAVAVTGIWRGSANITNCTDDGFFEGACQTDSATQYSGALTLTLIQSGSAVTGTASWAFVAVTVNGTVTGARLTGLTGRAPTSASVEASIEDWDSTIAGNAMTGTFTVRHFPRQNGIQGAVRWRLSLVNVIRIP